MSNDRKAQSLNPFHLDIIANSIAGPMSGGDRIWIECARRWASSHDFQISVLTTSEGAQRARSYGLNDVNLISLPSFTPQRFGVYLSYVLRSIAGCISMLRSTQRSSKRIVFSSSDFVPDSLPALLAKILIPSTVWIAAFYMFAPIPFDANSPYRGKRRWRGFLYFVSQSILFSVIQKFADMIFVTNDLDRLRFINKGTASDRIFTIWGGVDNKLAKLVPDKTERVYDAVFIGRLHPQKGVLQLVDIWKKVCTRRKDAKLAVIGEGELEKELQNRIATYGLSDNITLFGFRDGREKIAIFKDSSIVVHPATYDSGGMAACEAMACGLPGVSFDLPSLRVYYPKGMLKVPCFDLDAFAADVLKLVDDKDLYRRMQSEAQEFALEMDWDVRSKSALLAMQPILTKPLGGA